MLSGVILLKWPQGLTAARMSYWWKDVWERIYVCGPFRMSPKYEYMHSLNPHTSNNDYFNFLFFSKILLLRSFKFTEKLRGSFKGFLQTYNAWLHGNVFRVHVLGTCSYITPGYILHCHSYILHSLQFTLHLWVVKE